MLDNMCRGLGIYFLGAAAIGGGVVGAGGIGVAKGYCLSQGIDNALVDVAAFATPFAGGTLGAMGGYLLAGDEVSGAVYGVGLLGLTTGVSEVVGLGLGYVGGKIFGGA